MCVTTHFPISESLELTINSDCSITITENLDGDFDFIQISQDDARKIAQILIEELG